MTTNKTNQLWGHKWGYADSQFVINDDGFVSMTGKRYSISGYSMPQLLPYIEGEIGLKIDLSDAPQEIHEKPIASPNLNYDFYHAVKETFPPDKFTLDDEARLFHSHGQTSSVEIFRVLYSKLEKTVDMVFYCETEEDAQNIVRLAKEYNVCLVPFGGGTNVSCALQLPKHETRMIVSVDMKPMNKIEWVDKENLRACIQAGITGKQLEETLNKQGYTTGHEPDSLELSTLGGWISTNASGMKKNKYGNIEDIVQNVTLVTPTGTIQQLSSFARVSMGMQLNKLLFGSEGNLGLITKAVLKIHRLPEKKKYTSLVFPNFKMGVEFMDKLTHEGCIPASIRLVDNTQLRASQALKPEKKGWKLWLEKAKKFYLYKIKNFHPKEMVAATIVMEGNAHEVAYQEKTISSIARQYQALSAGSSNGKSGYSLTFAIAYLRDFLFSLNFIGDSIETTVPWSKATLVCEEVEKCLEFLYQKYNLPGKPYFTYRVTQVYQTDVCVYFTLALYLKDVENKTEIFHDFEDSIREVILQNGGSISHHHGVGKLRSAFMGKTISSESIEILHHLKDKCDPLNNFGISNNLLAKEYH